MLSEHLIASISGHSKSKSTSSGPTAAALKDAGIFVHELQPLAGQRAIFKKSATAPNCIAVSEGYIFAAQEDKAVIHVYSRAKGNLEAIVPFQEKACSLALACADTVLVIGMESGKILLWEVCSGRITSTAPFHLQKVTALAVSPDGNFLISGSADSQVRVSSLTGLLSFTSTAEDRLPLRTLTSHRGPITALAAGHSSTTSNFVLSASEDSSVIVWNYHTGEILRTNLLLSPPRALTLDPADRGVYTCFSDGSIQLLDFFTNSPVASLVTTSSNTTTAVSNKVAGDIAPTNQLYASASTKIVQPNPSSIWTATSQDLSDALSLCLSWDGSILYSGHASGKIVAWITAKRLFSSVLSTLPGPVSNLCLLPPTGFVASNKPRHNIHYRAPSISIQRIVKPRFDVLPPSSRNSTSFVPENYTLSAKITPSPCSVEKSTAEREFASLLTNTSFSASVLSASIADLASWSSEVRASSASKMTSGDFMSIEETGNEGTEETNSNHEEVAVNTDGGAELRALQAIVKEQFKQIKGLKVENKTLIEREEEAERKVRRLMKQKREEERSRENV